MLRPSHIIVITLATVIVGGCSFGHDYVRPQILMPDHWRDPSISTDKADATLWWKALRDPVLDGIVEKAFLGNNNLMEATARVEHFQAMANNSFLQGIELSNYSAFARGYVSESRQFLRRDRVGSASSSIFNLTWEIDLWGKLSRTREAARAELLAQKEVGDGVALTLVASIVSDYSELRGFDEQLELLQNTLIERRKFLKLVHKDMPKSNERERVVSELEGDIANLEALASTATLQRREKENQISVLVGDSTFVVPSSKPLDELIPEAQIRAGLPSSLLEQRPDVIEAEQELIASNALVGAAKADYFPQLSLTGLFGFASPELSHWLNDRTRQWLFSPGVSTPILSADHNWNQVKSAKADEKAAEYHYRGVILTAFNEVDSALAGYRFGQEALAAHKKVVAALARYLSATRRERDHGNANNLDVIDAEKDLFSARQSFIEAKKFTILQYALVYTALGGNSDSL